MIIGTLCEDMHVTKQNIDIIVWWDPIEGRWVADAQYAQPTATRVSRYGFSIHNHYGTYATTYFPTWMKL